MTATSRSSGSAKLSKELTQQSVTNHGGHGKSAQVEQDVGEQ
jgi:hypothetical protein